MEEEGKKIYSDTKGRVAVICGLLGHLHKGEYMIEPDCLEGVKDLIRLLKKDDSTHVSRRCLGEINIVTNHLVHIVKACPLDMTDLFNVTLRLLINLTTPAMLLYGEEIPQDKADRHIYLTLVTHDQNYKHAFEEVEFWNKICSKLTNLFETDWADRSADDGIEIERILTLVRNVLHIPADVEDIKRPDNYSTIHDKVLCALRESQILELLLFVSSNQNEEPYYLNLLEIFSLLLREQSPRVLARCNSDGSKEDKCKDTEDLIKALKSEKVSHKNYANSRNFNSTFVLKGMKSISNTDIVCHKALDRLQTLNVGHIKQSRRKKNKIVVESQPKKRLSTYSVRLFLKEFCSEFLNSSFNQFLSCVKNRLCSGKSLAHDQTYYFWAISFFLEFAIETNVNTSVLEPCLSMESFHFIQMSLDSAFEHLNAEKKKIVDWVRRIHTILKAYRSLLEVLLWMDMSKSPLVRSISREIKSNVFYVVEYREMTLNLLFKYEQTKFPVSYLTDLIATAHLFTKLLEEFSKQSKLVVQKVSKKRNKKKGKKKVGTNAVFEESKEELWEKIKDDLYDILVTESCFPEIPPFDATLDIPIDDQKGRAMKNIQTLLHKGDIKEAVGLLRSSRQVWPENDYFGFEGMMPEDEVMALQEICIADLGLLNEKSKNEKFSDKRDKVETNSLLLGNEDVVVEEENEEEDDDGEHGRIQIVDQDFDIMDFKKRFVHKKIVETCGILLKNYKKNSNYVNHCALKVLHRIGWECCMPAMLYQASLFWTLLNILNERNPRYNEINTFTINLFHKFRKHASKSNIVFLDLLFWKDHNVALEIQHGYQAYEDKKTKIKSRKSDEAEGIGKIKQKKRTKKKRSPIEEYPNSEESDNETSNDSTKHLRKSKNIKEVGGKKQKETSTNSDSVSSPSESDNYAQPEVLSLVQSDSEESSYRNTSSKINFLSRTLDGSDQSGEEDNETEVTIITANSQSDGTLSNSNNRQPVERRKHKQNDELKAFSVEAEYLDSDENRGMNSKRQRFMGSDSEEDIVVVKKSRKRTAVVESDSDVEDLNYSINNNE